MVAVNRVQIGWTGTAVVGGGVSTLYTLGDPHDLMVAFRSLVDTMKANLPTGLTITFPTSGEILDSATGQATGAWTAAAVTAVTGTDSGAYAGGVGQRIAWSTDSFANGRRIKGSTFIVPLGAGAYDTNGTLNGTMNATHNAAVTTFLTAMAGDFVILSRPSAAHPTGGVASVTSGRIPDQISWLVSRRT